MSLKIIKANRILVIWIFFVTVAVSSSIALSLLKYDKGEEGASVLIVVMTAGILGSLVSILIRVISTEETITKEDFNGLTTSGKFYFISYALIPPLIGAISAVVLYLIFAGEMIAGSLFPVFHCELGEDKCTSFDQFVSNYSPKGSINYAKAIVWGFIAGFSERLLPNILDSFTDDNSNGNEKAKDVS